MHELYVLPYVGSKRRMVNDIQMLAPVDAKELYEVCGGLGAYIINKHRFFGRAVYNELNPQVFNMMSVVKSRVDELCDRIMLTDNTEDEFMQALERIKDEGSDEIQRALDFVTLQVNSYNNNRESYMPKDRGITWKRSTRKRLYTVSEELQSIELVSKDCFDIMREQRENKNAFIMMDLPYPFDSQRVAKKLYKDHDWDDQLHQKAYSMLEKMNGDHVCKVMVCSYRSDLYDKLIDTGYWQRIEVKDMQSSAGGKGEKRNRRMECVYINYTSVSPLAKMKYSMD